MANENNPALKSNLAKVHAKIDDLEAVRKMILDEIGGMGNDFRKKMVFTEMLKNLLDVDKTILQYLKESTAILSKEAGNKGGADVGNALIAALIGSGNGLLSKKAPVASDENNDEQEKVK